MKKTIFLLALGCVFAFSSCSQDPNVEMVFIHANKASLPSSQVEKEMDNAAHTMLNRLGDMGCTEKRYYRLNDDNEVHIFFSVKDEEHLEHCKFVMMQRGELRFWETYDHSEIDPILREILQQTAFDIDNDNELVYDVCRDMMQQMRNNTHGITPVIARVKEDKKAVVDDILNSPIAQELLPHDISFAWTAKPQFGYYELIALRGEPVLDNDAVKSVSADFSRYNSCWQVNLEMTEAATETWAYITQNNIRKSIAIMLDGKVYSFPVVQECIKGGKAQITGSFTQDEYEAKDFAAIINSWELPCEVVYVETKQLKPFSSQTGIMNKIKSIIQ